MPRRAIRYSDKAQLHAAVIKQCESEWVEFVGERKHFHNIGFMFEEPEYMQFPEYIECKRQTQEKAKRARRVAGELAKALQHVASFLAEPPSPHPCSEAATLNGIIDLHLPFLRIESFNGTRPLPISTVISMLKAVAQPPPRVGSVRKWVVMFSDLEGWFGEHLPTRILAVLSLLLGSFPSNLPIGRGVTVAKVIESEENAIRTERSHRRKRSRRSTPPA